MKRHGILYSLMAFWMFLASSVGAAVSVCRAPCCMPTISGTQLGHGGGHCGSMRSTEAEAAAFFADETGGAVAAPATAEIVSLESSTECVAHLVKDSEYATHQYSDGLQIPDLALLPRLSSPRDPAWNFPASREPLEVSPSSGPPIFLTVSSFLC